MATEMNVEAERAAFEAWHRSRFATKHSTGQPTRDMHNGVYAEDYGPENQQQMWEAWQAARRAAQPADVGATTSPQVAHGVKTWFDRAAEQSPGTNPQHWSAAFKAAWMLEEITDLRAQLARQSQGEAIGYVALDDLEALAKTPRKPIREGDYLRMYLTPFTEHQRATKPVYAAPPLSSEQQDPPINQCDGCRQGAPMTSLGNHIDSNGKPFMYCQKQRYESFGEQQAEKGEGACGS